LISFARNVRPFPTSTLPAPSRWPEATPETGRYAHGCDSWARRTAVGTHILHATRLWPNDGEPRQDIVERAQTRAGPALAALDHQHAQPQSPRAADELGLCPRAAGVLAMIQLVPWSRSRADVSATSETALGRRVNGVCGRGASVRGSTAAADSCVGMVRQRRARLLPMARKDRVGRLAGRCAALRYRQMGCPGCRRRVCGHGHAQRAQRDTACVQAAWCVARSSCLASKDGSRRLFAG